MGNPSVGLVACEGENSGGRSSVELPKPANHHYMFAAIVTKDISYATSTRPLWTDPTRRAATLGLISAILLYICFGLIHVFALHIYKPGDEKRHTQYVVVLESQGRLPTIEETRAASHPPLYYGLIAKTVMRGVESTDGIGQKVRWARIISLAFGAIALIYAFLIIRLLLPGYPALAVHATAIMAVIPSYANVSAALGNDSLALASQFAMIYAALVVLLRGPNWSRCLQLALYLSIAALTRVSGVLVIPTALLAVVAGAWWHLEGSRSRRAGLALLIAGTLLASVVLSSGWFYLRNVSTSGDPTGQSAILEQVRYHPVRSALAVIFDGSKWLKIHDETWGRLAGLVSIKGSLLQFARLLTVISVAGAVVSLWRARIWQGLRDWRTPRFFSWVILAGVFASVFIPALVYHARGGGLHQRYLFGALYVWTLVFAVGFTWTKQNLAPIAGYCATFMLCYSLHVTYAALIVKRVKTFPIEQALGNAFRHPGAWTLWLMVWLTLGFVGVIYALAQLHRPLADNVSSVS